MLQTYPAILENNHLQWTNEEPEPQNSGRPLAVLVTFIDEIAANELPAKKEALLQVMSRLAARNSLSTISDPVAWQQEIRTDRNLPGRE
jgi:hypothetical protein